MCQWSCCPLSENPMVLIDSPSISSFFAILSIPKAGQMDLDSLDLDPSHVRELNNLKSSIELIECNRLLVFIIEKPLDTYNPSLLTIFIVCNDKYTKGMGCWCQCSLSHSLCRVGGVVFSCETFSLPKPPLSSDTKFRLWLSFVGLCKCDCIQQHP